MIVLKPPYPRELVFTSTQWRMQEFEFRSPEGQVATLHWDGFVKGKVLSESAGGHWEFRKHGLIHTSLQIMDLDRGAELGTFTQGQSEGELADDPPLSKAKGCLEMADGRCYYWCGEGFWHPEWSFLDADANALVTFKINSEFLKAEIAPVILPGAEGVPEIEVILLLAGYILLEKYMQTWVSAGMK